ncbi:lipoate--protein ligase [Liquorilactobacillus satsumensis]|uniref:lipoate--protein ligase n=1 Tax=Liquorilactobacillus satsumensis TaxID=259059 RepID=UPI0006CFD491|nr:lipoate--protein ligase [Liquorilactobacillus satsumensis]MCC7666066.1 lipoate--protein ligase [Liquorilactobacillus satsumensis]MCP9312520.1 lipoate--protein ligase [Liquorilactobacillus satsumensis]MCP9328823.1 lipoate--protein ligase [Liquorilactobacillus satsumensis]MCP9356827.1 lipoate--protein ligase [Liquorilactobacillus satsumensis]MCP9360516.1 lipoate--protein ligase [Liquorilactobacillus satsumensis]
MQYVAMRTFDIRRNLATEQYLMNNDELQLPLMLFYIEKSCVIVGRNQNTIEEIDQKYCREHSVTVTRRLSGGGAMYQDLGNLCFSFIVDANQNKFGDFKTMVAPIVNALHEIGVKGAEVTGRNDIVVDGKKFSGNAMYTRGGKTFSHGTLMLDVDTDEVTRALNVPLDKIKSKGIKSVKSRVTNLRPYLAPEYKNITTEQFRDLLIMRVLGVKSMEEARQHEYQLTAADEEKIDQIEEKYYSNWDWVYGHSPNFTVKRRQHFTSGTIDARILVEKGKIENIKFYGDFFGTDNVQKLEKVLKGCTFDEPQIAAALHDVDLNKYFQGIPRKEVLRLLAD